MMRRYNTRHGYINLLLVLAIVRLESVKRRKLLGEVVE